MTEIKNEELDKQNKALCETSKLLFGETARLQIVNPKELLILKENARFFKKSTFKQLTENVKKDKRLSSVPLCHIIKDRLEVLSGNHRVQAAVNAGLENILVIVILEKLEKSTKLSIQLSHNSLVGEDDKQILSSIWQQIDDISAKCYAGLSSDTVGDLEKLKLVSFSTPSIKTKHITFSFTDSEHEFIAQVMQDLESAPGNTIYLADIEQFKTFFEAIQQVKTKQNIKNGSLALLRLIEFASEIPETVEG